MSATGAFCWYELRTTDLAAAQAFYAGLAGWRAEPAPGAITFYQGEQRVGGLVDLPEIARSRGAPAHWLGHIHVPDVEAMARRMVERGGQMLGPMRRTAEGEVAVVKDPQGIPLALSSRPDRAEAGFVWHDLNTTDREHAWSTYSQLFGWQARERLEHGAAGAYQTFAWNETGASVGAMAASALLPQVHTHWLFHLRVTDLDDRLARVRALGGKFVGPIPMPGGGRVAACDDPQGAAFGLSELPRSS